MARISYTRLYETIVRAHRQVKIALKMAEELTDLHEDDEDDEAVRNLLWKAEKALRDAANGVP